MLDLTNFDYLPLIKRLSDERICKSHTLHGIIVIHLHELNIEFSTKIISEIISMLVDINVLKVKKHGNGYIDYSKWKLNKTNLSI